MALYTPSLTMEDCTGLENNFYLFSRTIAKTSAKEERKATWKQIVAFVSFVPNS